MLTASWPAPAKLNLFLHITGRRPDGYHTLQTVFQFLDLSDTITFTVRGDGRIQRSSHMAGVPAEDDLVVKAARALQSSSGTSSGVDISVEKRIPHGAGLGGGSSDAATTLVALNRLWGLELDEERLASLGLTLGADVPVFVRGRAAWAEGVGEALTPLSLDEPWYVVVCPACQVPTADVFNAPELTRCTQPVKIRDYLGDGIAEDGFYTTVAFLMAETANDCEPVVRGRYPAVDEALRWLSEFAPARMTGTGAAVFARLGDREAAQHVVERMPSDWRGVVARGMNLSPVFQLRAPGDAQ